MRKLRLGEVKVFVPSHLVIKVMEQNSDLTPKLLCFILFFILTEVQNELCKLHIL